MIIGAFDDMENPYVSCRLAIPQFRVDTEVNFLVDTGSDSTVLHPYDLQRLGISSEQLQDESVTAGVGGFAGTFLEPAILTRFHQGLYPALSNAHRISTGDVSNACTCLAWPAYSKGSELLSRQNKCTVRLGCKSLLTLGQVMREPLL